MSPIRSFIQAAAALALATAWACSAQPVASAQNSQTSASAAANRSGCALDSQPRAALDQILAAHARGDVPALAAWIDPGMQGYAALLDGAAYDAETRKLVRVHLFDTQWQCGPDLVAVQTRWEKRWLDAVSYRPQLDEGQMSVLLFRDRERWRMVGLSGANPFGAALGALAAIEFGPSLVAAGAASPLTVVVRDADLMRRSSVDVVLRSSHGDREVVTLTATTPGRFSRPTLPMVQAAAVPGNGELELPVNGQVTLEYVDQQPGGGRPATVLRARASVSGGVVSPPVDTTPNPFGFNTVPPQAPSTLVTSSSTLISGINRPVPVSVSGGSYSINGGTFTSTAGSVNNGDQVRVQTTASATPGASVDVLLTVGSASSVSAGLTVVTLLPAVGDDTPDGFILEPINDAPNTEVQSFAVQITGINVAVPVTIVNGQYSINGQPFTAAPGIARDGDWLTLQGRTPTTVGEVKRVLVSVGSYSTTWDLMAADVTATSGKARVPRITPPTARTGVATVPAGKGPAQPSHTQRPASRPLPQLRPLTGETTHPGLRRAGF